MTIVQLRLFLLWLFVFCAAGSYWQWGMDWWAGLFGFAFVIVWFVESAQKWSQQDHSFRRQDNV